MSKNLDILILGASYGSLFANKAAMAGHNACMVCLPEEQSLINAEGTVLKIPARGREELVTIRSRDLDGKISATSTTDATPAEYDLIVLAMQEPQYSSPAVKELMSRIASSGVPCMSIMNMPPLAFLARLPGLDIDRLRECYTDPSVWDEFDPALVTLASPDPQAFRPPDQPVNVLQVALPTNFKVAKFEDDRHTDILRRLQTDIEGVRYEVDGEMLELPVKLKVHDSVWVPLAKWLMLLTGNYRCVQEQEMRPIQEAVHDDIDTSRQIYEWVGSVWGRIRAISYLLRSTPTRPPVSQNHHRPHALLPLVRLTLNALIKLCRPLPPVRAADTMKLKALFSSWTAGYIAKVVNRGSQSSSSVAQLFSSVTTSQPESGRRRDAYRSRGHSVKALSLHRARRRLSGIYR